MARGTTYGAVDSPAGPCMAAIDSPARPSMVTNFAVDGPAGRPVVGEPSLVPRPLFPFLFGDGGKKVW